MVPLSSAYTEAIEKPEGRAVALVELGSVESRYYARRVYLKTLNIHIPGAYLHDIFIPSLSGRAIISVDRSMVWKRNQGSFAAYRTYK